MYEIKQKEKEQKLKLANEIIKFKEKLQLEDELEEIEEKEENNQNNLPEIRIDEINEDDIEQHSETSETYTELLANIDNTKNLEVNTGDIDMDEKPTKRYMELLCKRPANDLFQFKEAKEIDMDEVQRWILSLLKRKSDLRRRALK
ncbi:hypothetical protein H5410_005951 [Solanum commersonii]|uniref:Uncharacterized protein n=1 Tax=Solanum commersonii TaxID=4109 RepID=A0A9J6A808_SOLCO|nr:hypothetical protein H5410_005951 [Solanum commersonii]